MLPRGGQDQDLDFAGVMRGGNVIVFINGEWNICAWLSVLAVSYRFPVVGESGNVLTSKRKP